jgi:hypothetical protein
MATWRRLVGAFALVALQMAAGTHDHHVLLVGVLHGDVGYAITWLARRGEANARPAEFERILETFRFTE